MLDPSLFFFLEETTKNDASEEMGCGVPSKIPISSNDDKNKQASRLFLSKQLRYRTRLYKRTHASWLVHDVIRKVFDETTDEGAREGRDDTVKTIGTFGENVL